MADKEKQARISTKQRLLVKNFVKELEQHRGRHTELVSVYIPTGYDINKINNHLAQEQGTASNIKSASTRKNVQDALEKMIQHLKLFPKTPPNGLCVFSGNVAEREGQQDFQVWSIEPPIPLNQRLYRCDKEFVLDPLRDIVSRENTYGLVVVDMRDATLAVLKGKTIVPLQKTHSEVPGKTRAGGQCNLVGTIIQSANGSLFKIENCRNSYKIVSMVTNNYSIKNSPITDKWIVKKQEVYKIHTKYPQLQIECSKDHKVFVASDKSIIEKIACQLTENDYLIMPEQIIIKGKKQKINFRQYFNTFVINKEGRQLLKQKRLKKKLLQKELAKKLKFQQTTISYVEIGRRNPRRTTLKKICTYLEIDFNAFLKKYAKPNFASKHQNTHVKLPDTLNRDFAQFLGYFMGDGCSEIDRITFFEQRKEVALAYKKKMNLLFKLDCSYRFRETKNYYQLRFTSRPLVRLIQEEFPEIKKTLDSEVPEKILKSSNQIVASFLKGLFDAEGYVDRTRRVGIATINVTLMRQIQLLLLRFSIITSFSEYDNKKNPYSNKPIFKLAINEKESLFRFQKNIGFTAKDKQENLKNLIKSKTDRSYVRKIIFSGEKIKNIITNSNQPLKDFKKANMFLNDSRMMSKPNFLKTILKNIKDKKLLKQLKKIYNIPLLPVKIDKIEKRKENVEMIDISVKNKSFIANGLFVHNSAPRFARLREGAQKDHYKKVAALMKDQFLFLPDLKGILVGGPSTTTKDFLNKGYITGDVKNKIIAVKDLSYTDEFGLQELVERCSDVLAEEEVSKEKELVKKFLNLLATKQEMVSYGEAEVKKNMMMGAVDMVLMSETRTDELLDEFEEEADKVGTTIEVISPETREGAQLKELGGVAAFLRFPVHV